MADIIHEFSIRGPKEEVFAMFATPAGLNNWWAKESSGEPTLGAVYRLYFSPGYDWRAKVTRCQAGQEFELQMTEAHVDWRAHEWVAG